MAFCQVSLYIKPFLNCLPVFIKVVRVLIIITGFLVGCQHLHSDDVLLKIGSYTLSMADYTLVRNSAQYKQLDDEQLQDRLVEEGRILAYALEHRFDTIALLKKQLLYAMRYYASSVDGYVWNKKVKPLLQAASDEGRNAPAPEKYIREGQLRVLEATKPLLHETAIAHMAAMVVERERKWPGIDPGLLLMEYEFDGAHRCYTAADFMEFVQCQPVFMGSLANVTDIKNMLHSWLIGICLYAEGQQLGMEKDPVYGQVRQRYRYGIFINHFKQQHIYPRIIIDKYATASIRQALFSRQEKALFGELAKDYPVEINRFNDIQ